MATRMFVALRLPPDSREQLEDFLAPRLAAFDLAWTPPEHWHLTLAFFAAVREVSQDRLEENLATTLRRRHPITTRLAGAGAFPDPFLAKVLFLTPELSDANARELGRIAAACRRAATTAGIEVDGARFVPHVTLARARRGFRATKWLEIMDTFRGPTWEMTEVDLIASHPARAGRRHEVVATFPMAG